MVHRFHALFISTAAAAALCALSCSSKKDETDTAVTPDTQADPLDDAADGATDAAQEEAAANLPYGATCAADGECIEKVCFRGACTRACLGYAMCPEAGATCAFDGVDKAVCMAATYEEGEGKTGTSCAFGGDTVCADGYQCLGAGADDPYAYCTKECAYDAGCPPGYHCKALVEGEQALCRPRLFCDRCSFDDECGYAGDKCVADDDGRKFCSQQCVPDGTGCPPDTTCADIGGGVYQCLPDYAGHACKGDGMLCSPCEVNEDCWNGGGACIEDRYTHLRFCAIPCDDPACPAPDEFYCTADDDLCRPRRGSCSVPSGGNLTCDSCEDFTDCKTGFCLNWPDEYRQVCGEDCSETRTCPTPWATCRRISSGAFTVGWNCLPNDGITNCARYNNCVEQCPDGPATCSLSYCK